MRALTHKFKKIFLITLLLLGLFSVVGVSAPHYVLAATDAEKVCIRDGKKKLDGKYLGADNGNACVDGYNAGQAQKKVGYCDKYSGAQQDACRYGIGQGACSKDNPNQNDLNNCLNANPIIKDINLVVNFLSAGAVIVIVGSMVMGGIQFSWAGDNPNAVSAAKKRITDALIALIAFFFIFGFLQWLIPGGLLFK